MNTRVYNYFNAKEFKNLINELSEKYKRYGYVTGTIYINPDSLEEAEKLSRFLSMNIKMGIKNRIRVKDIQKSLDDSVFNGLKVNDIVLMFYPDIKSNLEIKMEKDNFIDSYLNKIIVDYGNSNICDLFKNERVLKKIKYLICNDKLFLDNVLKSLNELPYFNNDFMYLSIFASLKTGNPHYYDIDTHESNVFIRFICDLFDIQFSNNRRFKMNMLERAGILIDEVSNYCITYNLYGCDMLDSFKRNRTPLNINLANIQYLSDIKCVSNKLLIVENPSFISKIIGLDIDCSVIVISGNCNYVVYKLLEKIKNVKIYFNGDFDPEGLVIAQNFKNMFDVCFIGYNSKYYYNGISKNVISDSRLKKLDNVFDDELLEIKNIILKEKLASYQETNYDFLVSDIV